MGSCISKVLGLATRTQKDPDEAWKRQTLGGKENKLYTFVDLKGSTTNTELVEIWKKHGKEGFLRKLRDNEILSPYLYDNGMGKDVTAEEVKQWREETVPEVTYRGLSVQIFELNVLPRYTLELEHRT